MSEAVSLPQDSLEGGAAQIPYTKGPWLFDEDDETVRSEEGPVIAAVMFAADFPCLDVSEEEEDRIDAECARNGHMMAAAPELYAALVVALPFVLVHGSRYAAEHGLSDKFAPEPDEFHTTHKKLYADLSADLAKAEGRAADSQEEAG